MFLKKMFIGLASAALVLVAPATVLAGYAPADRPTYQCITPDNCPGADHVVFNSFTNAPNYGDERAFFDAKDATNTNPGGYQDKLTVHDGQRLVMRVYVHNNANPGLIGESAATAHNTKIQVALPSSTQSSQTAAAMVTASNADPGTVSDTVDMTGASPFSLKFDRNTQVMITYRPNGTGDYVTRALPGSVFANDWTMNTAPIDWKGCFNYAALITVVAVVHMPTVVTPDYACDLLSVTSYPNRKVDASVTYHATGGATYKNSTFDWGDGLKDTTTGTTSSHTYGKDGNYTINATLTFDVGGTNKTASCSKQVSFSSNPTPPTTPPTPGKLPNTGAGSVAGLFAGVSVLAGAAHYMWGRRFGRL